MKRLVVVEAAFAVRDRGTILAPELDLGPRGALELTVELRRPDGSRETCSAKAQVPMLDPPQLDREPKHVLIVDAPKNRVPVGTEVWLVSDEL